MEIRPRAVCSEPRGGRAGLLFLAFALVSLLGWVFLVGRVGFGGASDGPHVLLVIGVAFVLAGLAESLPAGRKRVAGVLRLAAVGILVSFIVLAVAAPELLLA